MMMTRAWLRRDGLRRCNLGTGDFNNDLTISETPGDVWSASFTGSSVAVIAPKETGRRQDRSSDRRPNPRDGRPVRRGTRQAQQEVCEVTGLSSGKHTISIVNRGSGPVAVDALIVR